jgi:hypothetical protein
MHEILAWLNIYADESANQVVRSRSFFKVAVHQGADLDLSWARG